MRFDHVAVANLRCLERLEFAPSAGSSLIVGSNGSGKTSLLEACTLAAQGKSFLTHRVGDLVRRGQAALTVVATVVDASGYRRRISVSKDRTETRIDVDGQTVRAASQLARTVPMLVINSQAPELLTGGPSQRRALLDRTMFHVEQRYIDVWKAYRQALRQRNTLLRAGARAAEAAYWNAELDRLARRIDAGRTDVIGAINAALGDVVLADGTGRIAFDYRPGWDRAEGLERVLAAHWDRDAALGFTAAGPHRADLSLKGGDAGIARRLSRGQCKAVVCTVVAATARYIAARSGTWPVLLVDDLAAELDDRTRTAIVDMIGGLEGQHIFTAIKEAAMPEVARQCGSVFHVEHHRSVQAG